MLRRSFFKTLGVALATLAAAYVPGKPWEVFNELRPRSSDWTYTCAYADAGVADAFQQMKAAAEKLPPPLPRPWLTVYVDDLLAGRTGYRVNVNDPLRRT